MSRWLQIAALVALVASASAGFSCLNMQGKPVDWFFVIKFQQGIGQWHGYTAAYIDSTNPDKSAIQVYDFHFSNPNPVAATVKQLGIYGGAMPPNRQGNYGWAFWNDETYLSFSDPHPVEHWNNTEGYNYGHTKGVLTFEATSKAGFYLQHSTPGFPYSMNEAPDYFHLPFGQSYFAQHFFCVSLSLDQIENVAAIVRYYNAFIYDSNVPSGLNSRVPNFAALTQSNYLNGSQTGSITSLGGQKFTLIGKDGNLDADLYEDYVCPTLNAGLTSMTWCCGWFDPFCCIDSFCKGKPVVNPSGPQRNEKVYPFDSTNLHTVEYSATLKFNVSTNHAKFSMNDNLNGAPWVCTGDMNRMVSQRVRGGGSLCQSNPKFFNFMKAVVKKFDTC